MAEESLHRADIGAVAEQIGGVAVTQGVWTDIFSHDAGLY